MAPVREVLSYSSMQQLVLTASTSSSSTLAGKRPRTDQSNGRNSSGGSCSNVSLIGSIGSSLLNGGTVQEVTPGNVVVRPVVLQDFGKALLTVYIPLRARYQTVLCKCRSERAREASAGPGGSPFVRCLMRLKVESNAPHCENAKSFNGRKRLEMNEIGVKKCWRRHCTNRQVSIAITPIMLTHFAPCAHWTGHSTPACGPPQRVAPRESASQSLPAPDSRGGTWSGVCAVPAHWQTLCAE
jgi:hypothetical protein